MTDDRPDWTKKLNLGIETTTRFEVLSETLNILPPDLIGRMIDSVVRLDEQLLRYKLPGLSTWQIRADTSRAS